MKTERLDENTLLWVPGKKVKIITTYTCPICKVRYDNLQEAEKCLNQNPGKRLFNVGDIVTTGHWYYGWHDGKKSWVYKHKPEPKEGESHLDFGYKFYHVVTFIELEGMYGGHRWKYHLHTKAMESQATAGSTTPESHKEIVKVKSPPKSVVKESKEFLGNKTDTLL